MAHPEVGDLSDRQIIGFNPVYATHQAPTTKSVNFPVLWGMCAAVALIAIVASGGLLWSKAEKSETEVQAEVREAVIQERTRVTECLNEPTPVKK